MKTNKATKLMMMYGLAAAMSMDEDIYSSHKEFTEDELNRMKQVKQKRIKTIIPKNHKEFFYGENSVWALNKKNADRKAKSKGYLCT